MCSHYQAEKRRRQIEKHFGIRLPPDWEPPPGGLHIWPTYMAPMIRRPPERETGDEAVPEFEIPDAHFGLLPGFAKEIRFGTKTYNARSETVAELPSFKSAWAKARHCIVPCEAIYEPDWRSGRNIPTRFTHADSDMLGVAGIWSPWRNPATNMWELSFAMLTINADDHPLFKLMHRPDPTRPPHMQDKRMVVILPASRYSDWLDAPAEHSMEFMRQFPAEQLAVTPEPPPPKESKPAARPPKAAQPEAEPDLF